MSFLKKILPAKQAEVELLRQAFAKTEPQRIAQMPVRDFSAALLDGNKLIAEIKHKSPSHSSFYQPASPATLARVYQRNGAAALSIVTDTPNFGTSLSDVAAVKEAVILPVLVKDFVIDEVQLLAAWAAGADAVLLIVRMLSKSRLNELLNYAHNLGLHVLVECHDQTDIDLALAAKAKLIGVNNRNLATLTTDLSHGAALLPGVPKPAIRISESGLYQRRDILHMAGQGADAFLVGHALLHSRDPGRKVAELCGHELETVLRVKTCGITNIADALIAHEAGSNILGLIFASGERMVGVERACAIRQAVPKAKLCGVFVNENPQKITEIAKSCDLDLIQLHGNESPDTCKQLAESTGLPLIKALTPNLATAEHAGVYDAVAYFLVDLPKGHDKEGQTPEDCRSAALSLAAEGHEVFLAGGLNPDNVHSACSGVKPFAVDVASGIECSPGVKDHDRIRAFIAEATR